MGGWEHELIIWNLICNDPVSVLGFVPGFMYELFMIDCGPRLMDMLFD